MGLKVATTCLQWSQPIVPQSPSSSQTLASTISSPSRRRSRDSGVLVCRFVHRPDRSSPFGTKLNRSRSCEYSKSQIQTIRRACSASLDDFSDKEFSKKIQELAHRFQLSDEDENSSGRESVTASDEDDSEEVKNGEHFSDAMINNSVEPPWVEDIIPATIERKANSVDLPLSLRIIKRKLKWQEGFREAGESAYCSVKKAFSSMVFIIRELHSFTLQMREMLLYEDLQGILRRVQKEMHASFVWLFQQVFSHTPTLMVYVMILLANFTVHSMASNNAFAAPSPASYALTTETVSVVENHERKNPKFDSSAIKTFSVSNSSGKTTSIGGSNGGGGKVRPIASGTDGEGWFNGSDQHRTILPDGASQLSPFGTTGEAESVTREDEFSLWDRIVEEASEMQAAARDESLDRETVQRLVSPVTASIEEDDYADYLRTELLYQTGLTQDPNNALLLANYAQFLYLVARDYDRAEEYFKKAIKVEPPDAEAYSKYANFLWQVRKDLWAAEETFLEAISADPGNSHYAANYAHFLWNTGGEDTCFPLDTEQA